MGERGRKTHLALELDLLIVAVRHVPFRQAGLASVIRGEFSSVSAGRGCSWGAGYPLSVLYQDERQHCWRRVAIL